ncbi:protein WALLS ARE THIN 1-like isoform X1 [Aristolochia californica]|uniref:protein WALLS ARE THIN 1-like isoform X1 n=1 Tax=Aristolochia californica TaxID=171875 RepID=UPI0035DD4096
MAEPGSSSLSKKLCAMPERTKLHLAMLALQFGYAGFHVVSRAALNMGISKLVFPVYRNIIALLLLLPFAYFLEKKERPALTLSFLVQFFLLALCGITANQGFYLLGLDNTSPTFASAIQNSVPAITFLMAVALRQTSYVTVLICIETKTFIIVRFISSDNNQMNCSFSRSRFCRIEQVRIKRKDGIAKLLGTLACVGGATVITIYKGPTIYGRSTLHGTYFMNQQQMPILGDASAKNWTLGCIYLIGHCLSWSGWLVLQAPVLKKYPARLSVTSYTCFFGVIQFLVIAAFAERNLDAWVFHSGGEVFTIFYAGFVASGIAFAVQIWCIDRGGPVFVAVYQPVQTLVVAIMASVALGEEFHLGGILGAILIIIGLYLVLWGKSEERKLTKDSVVISSASADHARSGIAKSSLAEPLLPSSSENV